MKKEKLTRAQLRRIKRLAYEETDAKWQSDENDELHTEFIYDLPFSEGIEASWNYTQLLSNASFGLKFDSGMTTVQTQKRIYAGSGGRVSLDAAIFDMNKCLDIEMYVGHLSQLEAVKKALRYALITIICLMKTKGIQNFYFFGLYKEVTFKKDNVVVPCLRYEYTADTIGHKIPCRFLLVDARKVQEAQLMTEICHDHLQRRSSEMHNSIIKNAKILLEGEEVQSIMCKRDEKIAQKNKAEGISIGRAEMLAERVKASIEIGLDEETICKAFGITPEELRDRFGK